MNKKKLYLTVSILLVILVISVSYLFLFLLTPNLEINVINHTRRDDGQYYVIVSVKNNLDKDVKGSFVVELEKDNTHYSYGGMLTDVIPNPKNDHTYVIIPSGASITKEVVFDLPIDEIPDNVRFYTWSETLHGDSYECSAKLE